MKKTTFLFKIAVTFLAVALPLSCDSGGGGGGGSSGGGNSNNSDSTSISITIPKSLQSSSDINLLGDFTVPETESFSYGVWFESTDGKTKVSETFGGAGDKITFDNVKYASYNFFLKIYVDNRHKVVINTLKIENREISASNNLVQFPNMSTSDYADWYFVKSASLTGVLSRIDEKFPPTAVSEKKAKLCLLETIVTDRAAEIKSNQNIELFDNGFKLASHIYTITYELDGGTNSGDNPTVYTPEDEEITLSAPTRGNYLFYGWYEAPNFSGEKISTIASGSTGNKTFYARWVDSVYIMSTFDDASSDANDGLSADTPVNALSKVIAKINAVAEETGVDDFDWKIMVDFDLPLSQLDGSGVVKARSLTIMGHEGMNTSIDASSMGTALTLTNLNIPVTIKYLKITGGKIGNNGKGAGISITNCSEGVTLSEGTEVSGNTAEVSGTFSVVQGIGIYVQNSNLTLSDGAKVTNNTIDSSSPVDANRIYCGGGVYANENCTVTISGSAEVTGNDGSPGYGKGVHLVGDGSGEEMLVLQDSAKVDEIYLDGGNGSGGVPKNFPKINVSGMADSSSVQVYGKLVCFAENYKLLNGSGVPGLYNKFEVKNCAYKIGSSGKLEKKSDAEFTADDLLSYASILTWSGLTDPISAGITAPLVFMIGSSSYGAFIFPYNGTTGTPMMTVITFDANGNKTETPIDLSDPARPYINLTNGTCSSSSVGAQLEYDSTVSGGGQFIVRSSSFKYYIP